MAASGQHRGWWYDPAGRLTAQFNGTEVFDFDADDMVITPATTVTTSLTSTGNFTISSTLTAGSDGVGADGEQLTSGGAGAECDWAAAASLTKFKNLLRRRQDADKVLEQMVKTPVYDFQYKREGENGEHMMSTGDYDTVYTGIVSEDAPWAMHFRGRILNPINTFGHTVLAIQALDKRLRKLEAV